LFLMADLDQRATVGGAAFASSRRQRHQLECALLIRAPSAGRARFCRGRFQASNCGPEVVFPQASFRNAGPAERLPVGRPGRVTA
jgi:hypothetical protein